MVLSGLKRDGSFATQYEEDRERKRSARRHQL